MNKKIIFTFSIFIFVLMYGLNYYTPHMSDDFCHLYNFGDFDIPIMNFTDWYTSTYNYYMYWGGRSQGIVRLFAVAPKEFFNVVNSLMIIAMLFGIYINLDKEMRKGKEIFVLILTTFLFWFGMPAFGESMIWLSGAINYLWIATFMLYFVYFYKKLESKTIKMTLLAILLGVLGGWSLENLSIATLVSLIIYTVVEKKINRTRVITLVSFLVGALVLLLAPGNAKRAANYPRAEFFIQIGKYFKSIKTLMYNTKIIWLVIVVAIIILFVNSNKESIKKILRKYYLEFIIAIFSVGAMIVSPVYAQRTYAPGAIFLIIFATNLLLEALNAYEKKNNTRVRLKVVGLICYVLFTCSYLLVSTDYELNNKRIQNGEDKEVAKDAMYHCSASPSEEESTFSVTNEGLIPDLMLKNDRFGDMIKYVYHKIEGK